MSAESRGPAVLAVTAAMIGVSTLFVALRTYSRIAIVKKFSLDDYLIVAAWLCAFGLSFSICYAVKFGLGKHSQGISLADQEILQRLDYSATVFYNPALILTKCSICVFYLTISSTYQWFRWGTYATIVVTLVAGLALSLLNIFECRYLPAIVEYPHPATAHCTDIITLYLSSAPVNIATDAAILLLPMPVLKMLRLPRKQKIILYITFSFGVVSLCADVVRIYYLQSATAARISQIMNDGTSNASQAEQADFPWYASLSFMWSAVEVNVGLCCSCVPALKPLVSRIMPQILRNKGEVTPEGTLHSHDTSAMDVYSSSAERIPSEGLSPLEPAFSRRPPAEDEPMSFEDFLDMTDLPQFGRTDTMITNASVLSPKTKSGRAFDFDFVNIGTRTHSLVQLTNQESIRPMAIATILFTVWGFATGLSSSLNAEYQIAAGFTQSETTAIASAYFIGYAIGPVSIGFQILKRFGFRASFCIGLILYGIGCLIFWPSGVLFSFPAFLISNIIVGIGLSTLEIAANPFIALCGPSEFAEARLNISQGFQAIASLVAPLLAKKALFMHDNLIASQYTYLALALAVFLLAFLFSMVHLPEATDEELENGAQDTFNSTSATSPSLSTLRRTRIVWYTLGLAVLAQFLYVSAQESVGGILAGYVAITQPEADSVWIGAICHAVFAASRFVAGFLGLLSVIKPRHLILVFTASAVILSALATRAYAGAGGTAVIIIVYAMEGPLFSLIYAQGLRGMGKYTKLASALLCTAVGGGAIFPPIRTAVANGHHGVPYSMVVPLGLFAAMLLFPIYLELVPLARKQTDPYTGVASKVDRRRALASLGLGVKRRLTAPRRNTRDEKQDIEHVDTLSHAPKSPIEDGNSATEFPRLSPILSPLDTTFGNTTLRTPDFRAHDFAFEASAGVERASSKERISSSSAQSDMPLLRAVRRLSVFVHGQSSSPKAGSAEKSNEIGQGF